MGHDLGRFLFLFALWAVLWLAALLYMDSRSDSREAGTRWLVHGVSWPRQALMFAVAIPAAIAGVILLATGLNDPDWIEAGAIFGGTGLAGLGWTARRRYGAR